MYDIQFVATSSAGWAESVELIDAETNLPLVVGDETTTFELDVRDSSGCQVLTRTTAGGTIERPTNNVVQWRFTPSDIAGRCRDRTYRVGLVMTTEGGATQIFIGTLALLDGEVR